MIPNDSLSWLCFVGNVNLRGGGHDFRRATGDRRGTGQHLKQHLRRRGCEVRRVASATGRYDFGTVGCSAATSRNGYSDHLAALASEYDEVPMAIANRQRSQRQEPPMQPQTLAIGVGP